MYSLSKYRRDINVITFFNKKKDLYFVDICSYNDNWFTNTGLLELNYNWKGISSQLFPRIFEKNKKHRKIDCYNYYLFNKSGLSLKFNKYNFLSGHKSIIGRTKHLEKHSNDDNDKIIVKTITLEDFLDKYNTPRIIHYFSLDNEGLELNVLKTLDFSKYTFLYISIEHNNKESKKTEVKNVLLNNGYLSHTGENNYIHESTIIGTYYKDDDTKPIEIKRQNTNDFVVSSLYWDDEIGTFNNGFIEWKTLGKGKVFYTHIDYGNGNIWQRSTENDNKE